MKNFIKLMVYALVLGNLAGCATTESDAPTIPTLSISPSLLIDRKDIGTNIPVVLKVSVADGALSGNPYLLEPPAQEVISDTFEDALERMGFDVSTDALDEQVPHTKLVVEVQKLRISVHKDTLKSEVQAEVAVKLSVVNPEKKASFTFSSLRTLEVALNASTDDVAPVVSRAVAQVVERSVKEQAFLDALTFDVNKYKKAESSSDEGLFGF